jgi:hypothetical protein
VHDETKGIDPALTGLPFDWSWEPNETIWPCDCACWRAELLLMGPDGAIWVREWHAIGCSFWTEIEGAEG